MLLLKAYLFIADFLLCYCWLRQNRILKTATVNNIVSSPDFREHARTISNAPLDKVSDSELIESVCRNDQNAIIYLFYKKFLPTFQYHIYKLFPYKEDVRDLIDEFFLYLFEDDWRRLRTFDGTRASLATWISVTSFRFFKSYKYSKIDSNGILSVTDQWESFVGDWVQSSDAGLILDIRDAINTISNRRDRDIAELIFIEDKEFQVVADRFDLSVDYVYTVKNRLVKQLKAKLSCYH